MTVKQKWVAFLLSFIPGVGHLYLGLNRQGLKFMIGFFLCITLIPSFPRVFPFVLVILWFYSLFDALQKTTLINLLASQRGSSGFAGEEEAELAAFESIREMQRMQQESVIEPLWLGSGCILAGVLLFIRAEFPHLWQQLQNRDAGSILLALGLIAVGVWLLYKNNSHRSTRE